MNHKIIMENWRRFMSESEKCITNTACQCIDSSMNLSLEKVQNFLADKYGRENMPVTFKTGQADGLCGPETRAMIEKFQEERDLKKCDGCVGPETGPAMFPELATDEQGYEDAVDFEPGSLIPGRSTPSQEVVEKLFTLTKAEVGSQGPAAIIAFMETVFNRAAIEEKSIDKIVSDRVYYQPIKTMGKGSIEGLMSLQRYKLSDKERSTYNSILQEVVNGSNITDGCTHNSSAGMAQQVKTPKGDQPKAKYHATGEESPRGGWDSVISSIRDVGIPPETFYSKWFEQKRIAALQKRKITKISVSE